MLYLLSILQHQGHNEFRLEGGPLILIDVDRTQFVVPPKPDIGFGYVPLFFFFSLTLPHALPRVG